MNDKNQKAPDAAANDDAMDVSPEMIDVVPDEEGSEIEYEKEIINDDMEAISKLQEELEKAKAELEKEKKEYMFLLAEFDNFRKRSLKEKSDIIKNASEHALKELLPVVDDFERAIEANRASTDVDAIRDGVELIYNKLVKYLEKNGVKAIDSTDKDFDADMHEAIAMVPVADDGQKGKVIDTLTKGYMLNDKVLRHAKVAVGQ